jgi:hypothetical protein
MWISRLFYRMSRDQAAEIRSLQESLLAARDSIIAKQEQRIRELEAYRDGLLGKLLERETSKREPSKPDEVMDGKEHMPDWMKPLVDQIDEGSDAQP